MNAATVITLGILLACGTAVMLIIERMVIIRHRTKQARRWKEYEAAHDKLWEEYLEVCIKEPDERGK